MYHQTSKTVPILGYNELTDESVRPELNACAGYELSHEIASFSIKEAKEVTARLINASTAVQNPKYHDNFHKPKI